MKHWRYIICIFLTAGLFSSCGSKGEDPVPEEKPVIGVPANLMTSDLTQGIRLTWSRVDNIDQYQVVVLNDTALTTNTWYDLKLNGDFDYSTQYTWKVRAMKGTTAGEWATSTLTTPQMPLVLKFIGEWETDSVKLNASMSGNILPAETFLPNEGGVLPPDQNIQINVDGNPDNTNQVFFSISGIDSYLPIGTESLNRVVLQSNSDGTIGGSQTVDYTYTYTFQDSLLLSALPNYDQILAQAGVFGSFLDENTAIKSVSVTINDVFVSGVLDDKDINKAVYTIQANAPVRITSNRGASFDNLLYTYVLSGSPLEMELTVYSTKK